MPCFGVNRKRFLSKICNISFPFLGIKIFSDCKFLGLNSVIAQNKFLAIKFMAKIGQQKTSGNYLKKLKSLESYECWPKLNKILLNWKLKIVSYIFRQEMCSIPIFLGAKFSVNLYYWV